MNQFDKLAEEQSLQKTIESLKKHNITSIIAENAQEAKEKVLALIPEKSEVMTMTSATLDEAGISHAINESGKYDAVRPKLFQLDRETQGKEMQQLGAAPDWAVGSAQTITEDGHIFLASNTGSQLGAYIYGSSHVVWVIGTQKIVKDDETAFKRLYDYVLPLESERAKKAYGVPSSAINKLTILYHENNPTRITVVFVKEKLGY
jgi:hypothetical protein